MIEGPGTLWLVWEARHAPWSAPGRYPAQFLHAPHPRELVKACHRRGIEVILDIVFNHTAEGNENGLCLSFR